MAWLVRWFKWLVYPTSFTVASATATVSIWNPYQIEYTITPSNATNKKVNWSSSDTTVATVDNKWVITAVNVWTCTITWVYSYDWTTRTISVTTSQVAVSWVSLDKDTMRVPMRWNWWLHATVFPSNASNKNIIWTSSDDSIATVEWWLVKFKKNWNCTITATTEDWWYTDTCAITCYTPVAWVSLNYTELNVPYLHPQTLIATVNPPEAEDRSVTWSSSDTTVATVDSNWVVTYVSNWKAIITCTTTDWWYTATCRVTCYIAVTWITLDNHSLIIVPGWTSQLTATVSPSDATNKNVIWTSSNEEIATVDKTWLVTHKWIWNCTITATTEDWWFTDTCSVQCVIPVTWVSLNRTSWEVSPWSTLQLTATITPSNATIKTVTWTSSNTSVATVNSSWVVTYVADWSAMITCTTVQWGKTATCTISAVSAKPVSQTFSYTWWDQSYTIPYTQCYKLEAWWWGSWDAKWWYASWVMCLTKWTVLRIMVWARWNNSWNRYWFGWSSNYCNCYNWAWLSWIFTGNTAIWASDSSRALVIWWWAWSCAGRWNGWAWGWECWASWWTNWYWTQWWWWTQSWRQSWWNQWWAQFCWGNGSWSYWAWWGWWWYWWNGTAWDGSAWDDKWAWGWSWYVKSTMTSRTLTQWWWSAAQTHWSVKISSV